jgi:hypothetical protein
MSKKSNKNTGDNKEYCTLHNWMEHQKTLSSIVYSNLLIQGYTGYILRFLLMIGGVINF